MNFANFDRFPFLGTLNLDQDVTDRLSEHLVRTSKGSDSVYITPLGKDKDIDKLLSEFDKVFNDGRSQINSVLLELEMSNRSKFGPRSIAIPWTSRKESLESSFNTPKIEGIIGQYSTKGNLRPLSMTKGLSLLKNNTNSGLPFYTRKGKVKNRVSDKFDSLLKRRDPCILFTRTQEQKKTRNVWGYPMADTLNEMLFYSPLLAYQKKLPYRSALISPEAVSQAITRLILERKGSEIIYSVDFSAYDTSVSPKLQNAAFNYIRSLFQPKFSPEIDYIEERFRSIGIVTPTGIMTGDHGVPSGSTFTNEVDSIVQVKISKTLPYITDESLQVQGDDGVYKLPKDKVDELSNTFESFGLTINRDKSYVSESYAVYLQNLFHIDYVKDGKIGGIYPIYRALNRLIYQERWSDFEDFGISGKDYYSIRAISICENCKYHPLFKELVKFVVKHDKYSLDVSDQGIVNYVRMMNNTYGAGEILRHQYGDDIKGIRSFETYKMIKELS